MSSKIKVELDEKQYRTLVDSLNEAADLTRAAGFELPEHVYRLLKQLLVQGLKAGWTKLPACFTGDDELMDAAAEGAIARKFEDAFPDPNTKH